MLARLRNLFKGFLEGMISSLDMKRSIKVS